MNSVVDSISNETELKSMLADAQIPALPTTAMRLLELSKNTQSGLDDYVLTIEADPSLSCQILRFSNSSYFGFSREISSIKQSLLLLGIRPIRNFALWSAVYSLVPNPTFGSFDLKSLWQDSLRRAVFSRCLGRAIQLPTSEELFVAALLQDVSIPIFLKVIPSKYEPLVAEAARTGERLSSLERIRFGWDHARASAILCQNWHLPEEISALIERHTDIESLFSGTIPQLDACCVALSALLPSVKYAAWPEKQHFMDAFERMTVGCGLDGQKLVQESDRSFAEFAPMLSLPPTVKTISDWMTEES